MFYWTRSHTEINLRPGLCDGSLLISLFAGVVILAVCIVLAEEKLAQAVKPMPAIETTINLPGATFDPIEKKPAETIVPGKKNTFGKGYYLVQLDATATDDLVKSLRDVGLEIIQYVPHNAYFVFGDGDAIVKAAGHSRVRWVGRYTPEQKLSPHVLEFARNTKGKTAMFDIAVFGRADLDKVADEFLKRVGGRIIAKTRLSGNFFNVLRVEMPPDALLKATALKDVFRIDPYTKPSIERPF